MFRSPRTVATAALLMVSLAFVPLPGRALIAPEAEASPSEAEILDLLDTLSQSDDLAFWRSLGPEEQQAVVDYLTPASITLVASMSGFSCDIIWPSESECPEPRPDEVHAASGIANAGVVAPGCWNMVPTIEARNVWGQLLWTYGNDVTWCLDGVKITGSSNFPRAHVATPFWFFRGHVANQSSGGAEWVSYTSYVQGNFEACLIKGWGCFSNKTPWVKVKTSGSGPWAYEGGS